MTKKIRAIILLCFGFMTAFTAGAQNFTLGVRTGISIPNLTGGSGEKTPLSSDYKSRFGPDEAIYGEYHFSGLFSLSLMAEYSSQGGKRGGNQALVRGSDFAQQLMQSGGGGSLPIDPQQLQQLMQLMNSPQTYVYADVNNVSKLNYLLIPLLAKFGWNLKHNSPVRFYFSAGPFAGFLLNAKQVIKDAKNNASLQGPGIPTTQLPLPGEMFEGSQNIKDDLHTFNVGFSGNVGFAYNFNEKSNIFIEGGGNYGFKTIQKNAVNGKNHVGAGTVGIGYGHTF